MLADSGACGWALAGPCSFGADAFERLAGIACLFDEPEAGPAAPRTSELTNDTLCAHLAIERPTHSAEADQ